MNRDRLVRAALAVLVAPSVLAAAGYASAGETVVPEESLVRAAARLEASTVRLRVSFHGGRRIVLGLDDATKEVERRLNAAVDWAGAATGAAKAGAPPAPAGAGAGGGDNSAGLLRLLALDGAGAAGTREAFGVFVGDGHAVLTAAAAVEDASRVEVVLPSGAIEGVVSGIDRDFGIAIVRSSASGEAIEIDGSSELEPGRILLVAGAAQGGGMDVRAVSSRETAPGRRGLARLAAPLPTEAVGAPALGPDGRLRAIVVSGSGVERGDAVSAMLTNGTTYFTNDAGGSWRIVLRDGRAAPGTARLDGAAGAASAGASLLPGRRFARAASELLASGRVRKAYLGVVLGAPGGAGRPLDDRRVGQVLAGSPAEGKLRAGDRIVAVGGRRLEPHDDVTFEILSLAPGEPATIEVERRGEGDATATVAVEVVPSERREDATARGPRAFGFDVVALTPELRAWTGVDGDGVLVTTVARGGTAERAGLRRGDLLVQVAGRDVRSADDVDLAVDDGLRRLAAGERVRVAYVRDGKPLDATLFDRREAKGTETPSADAPVPTPTPPANGGTKRAK